MLIEFTVGNYKSFKEPVTLSMVAAKGLKSRDRTLDANTVIPIDEDLSLLTSAAIYGANASGKSNLGDAFKFMRDFIINSSKNTQAGEPIMVEPFLLDPDMRDKPAHFEVIFLLDGIQYRYGFEVDTKRVVAEWLFHVPKNKELMLFGREMQKFMFSKTFTEGERLDDKTRDNALFLSVVAQFNGSNAVQITEYLDHIRIISGLDDAPQMMLTKVFLQFSKDCVLNFVRSLDIGIKDILLEGPRTKTQHLAYNSTGEATTNVIFDLESQESEGTKKIIALAGELYISLQNGLPFIIDEFDARLHPLLTREIVKLFNNVETNPKHAQLIFMTHDTNLLDKSLLRRDQIWFVEKDRFGASHLYSLAELKVRNDASFENDYIQGKYGAIPFLGGLQRVVEDLNVKS